jgi:regulator of cell morphogenesis and NO signaling
MPGQGDILLGETWQGGTEMATYALNAKVGQLVAERPARARVFEKFGIDYCCGGKVSLEKACARRKVDPDALLSALSEIDAGSADERDWTRASSAELVENIVSAHHDYLREELPALSVLVHKVARVHGEDHPELALVFQVFKGLKTEMEDHMAKEERVLFPFCIRLEEAGSLPESPFGTVGNPIHVMEHEHDDAGRALERLRLLTGDYTPPKGACNSYRAMLDRLHALESDLHLHIHKENNILFPRALEREQRLAEQRFAFQPLH